MNLSKIKIRPTIKYIKTHNYTKRKLVGCEIGVAKGNNALSILKNLPIERLYLVDPYKNTHINYEQLKCIAYTRLEKYYKKLRWIQEESNSAWIGIVESEQGQHIDFVYIDGLHSYYNVISDITYYYQLIRKGGVIGGHDWNSEIVQLAVSSMCAKYKKELHTKDKDWWFIK